MWDGQPVPPEVFECGPEYEAALRPWHHRLKVLGLPPEWEYAAPSEESRSGSCPDGWIPIHVEYVKLGLRFPLPSFDAFRLIYNIRDSTKCWSIGWRENAVALITGSPKLDSPWYREYYFARPSGQWYSVETAPLTRYAAGSKDAWCSSNQFPQSVRDHVNCIIEGVQFRVFPSGYGSAYQLVRDFYGLKTLADAVRPKKKKKAIGSRVNRGAAVLDCGCGDLVACFLAPTRHGFV
ncbi:unnamed protein product [Linum trigynum]|uniref:Uncharacterized protein n=1 Tax=Linum trigynum TaxID=586398 RepID=A0AAV2CC39_9ROSI